MGPPQDHLQLLWRVSKGVSCGLTNKSSYLLCGIHRFLLSCSQWCQLLVLSTLQAERSCLSWVHNSHGYPCPPGEHSWPSGALRNASAVGNTSCATGRVDHCQEAWICLRLATRNILTRPSPWLTSVSGCTSCFHLRRHFSCMDFPTSLPHVTRRVWDQ